MSDCSGPVRPQPTSPLSSSSACSSACTALPQSAAPPGPADKGTDRVHVERVQSCVAEVQKERVDALPVANVPCEDAHSERRLRMAHEMRDHALLLLTLQQTSFTAWCASTTLESKRNETESDRREEGLQMKVESLENYSFEQRALSRQQMKAAARDSEVSRAKVKKLRQTVGAQTAALERYRKLDAKNQAELATFRAGATEQGAHSDTVVANPHDLPFVLCALADFFIAPFFPPETPSFTLHPDGPLVRACIRARQ